MNYDESELSLIAQICKEIEAKHSLGKDSSRKLADSFGKRFQKAFELIKRGSVKRYAFRPSGRVIWEVRGKGSTYQVLPHTNFCSCDDYYFRVMNSKKQLCYHILAQRIASALGKFEKEECSDRDYGKVTRKWRGSVK